ncbi:hypothetical protein C1I98_22245 [Spongiactinospora gelatinilytica]|uniref:Uncharacterized protein n=1 Tax=Spongiactinospora gelatinilytica TaxID=2666298 RepID=A0A2W2FZ79_9ACTN|nr:hypothetical protein [Spongiactinospora gelatinilytica]PZG40962.1 hypothetical protein C1I98_22245 [Spongiactinospora gelatinilytica]
MDPSIIPALAAVISAVVGGAAGEAGKSAWTSLTSLVRRRFGRETAAELEPGANSTSTEMAEDLVNRAGADPEFARALAAWMSETSRVVQQQKHDVVNVIGGEARITGPVVQAGDVFGSINLGGRD